MSFADKISEMIYRDDWNITENFLYFLEKKWDLLLPIDLRFAYVDNCKCVRFNSEHLVLGTEAVDAFTQQNWRFEHTLIVLNSYSRTNPF